MDKYTDIELLIRKHKWTSAENKLLDLLRTRPNNQKALGLLRKLYFEKKDDQSAFTIAKKIYSLARNDPGAIWGYASSASNIGRNKDAVKLYKKLLQIPNETLRKNDNIRTGLRARGFKLDVCVCIGECYTEMQDYEDAVHCFKKYLTERKNSVPSMYTKETVKKYLKQTLLNFLFHTKRYNPETYRLAQQAYVSAPNDLMVIWSFAGWTSNMHNYDKAIELYKSILKKHDETLAKHPEIGTQNAAKGFKLDVCVRIGDCYMRKGDYQDAIPFLKKYLSEKSRNIPTEYNLKEVRDFLKECELNIGKKQQQD